jgi:hypothetical protein
VIFLNRTYAQAQSLAFANAPRAFLLALTRISPPYALLVAYWGANCDAVLSVPTREYFQSSGWTAPPTLATSTSTSTLDHFHILIHYLHIHQRNATRPHLAGDTAAVPKKQKACLPAVGSVPRDTTAVMGVAGHGFPRHYCTIWYCNRLPHHRMGTIQVMTRMERRL